MNRYEQIEDALVNELKGNFFEVCALPDAQIGFAGSTKVFVMYDNSDYPETENLGMIVQEDKIKVGFELHAKTRRGPAGIFAIQEIVFKKILGLKLPGYDKFQLVSFVPLQGCGPNQWMYYAQFTTTSHVAEIERPVNEPLLKQTTFEL